MSHDPEKIIYFGKHSGKTVGEVRSQYLRWLVNQEWFEDSYPDLVEPVEAELDWRDKLNQHF